MECSAHGNVSGTCGNVESKILKICLLCGQFNVITSRTRSLGQGKCFYTYVSILLGDEMMPLLVSDPMFFPGGLCQERVYVRRGDLCQEGGLCQEGLCQEGGLGKEGREFLSGGGSLSGESLSEEASFRRGSLSGWGLCQEGDCVRRGVFLSQGGALSGGGLCQERVSVRRRGICRESLSEGVIFLLRDDLSALKH